MKPRSILSILVAGLVAGALSAAAGRAAHAAEPPGQKTQPPPPAPGPAIDPKSKIVFLDAEAGIESANLNTFTEDFNSFSVGFLPRSGAGPALGAAVGVRLVFLTLAARGRVATFDDSDPSRRVHGWTMSSLDGELGFRAPLGRLEPSLTLAAGYTTFGGFGAAVDGLKSGLNVNGFNARLGVGVDYFVSRWVSLGGAATGELLALTRPGVPVREIAAAPQTQTLDVAAMRFLEANGSTYGTAVALTGNVKVHF